MHEEIKYLDEDFEIVPIEEAMWKVVHTYNDADMPMKEEWIEITHPQ